MNIGSLKLNSNVMLAPMAGITSLPFRMLNRGFGAECAFTEMISAKALVMKSKRTLKMTEGAPDDRPTGIQLFEREPDALAEAVEMINGMDFDFVDLNAACPQKKVTGKGKGAALLKEPGTLEKLLKIMVRHSRLPVTAKIRLGWDGETSHTDTAKRVRDAGVSALFVHGRTRSQRYSGQVNYKAVGDIKRSLDIPVIASGDIFSAPLAKKMFDETGCDGIIVARGALGNPWIFGEINEYLKAGILKERPGIDEVIAAAKKHLDMNVEYYGEKIGILNFRSLFIWYTKGFEGVKTLRLKVSHVATKSDMHELLAEFHDSVCGLRYETRRHPSSAICHP